jgi:hypothetical protein
MWKKHTGWSLPGTPDGVEQGNRRDSHKGAGAHSGAFTSDTGSNRLSGKHSNVAAGFAMKFREKAAGEKEK